MHGDPPFGSLLRALRAATGLTQEEVAERSGLSARAIGDLERGAVRRPQRKTITLLVDALELDEKDAQSLARAARRPASRPDADSGTAHEDVGSPGPAVPRQLPSGAHHFTGREEQLRRLRRWSEDAARITGSASVLTIDGMAGVGKTALALELGHALAARFPDGQLFLDLHGHTPGRAAVPPRDSLARMLRASGVGDDRMGEDVDELAELWRSTVADRRLLIVLDNAADADHVRPLIPGRGGSLVLVTSRRRLFDLDTAAGLSLDALAPEAAYALFTRIAGAERVIAQDADVREVVRRCGCLPLAVRIAAARLRHRPAWRVADLLEQLDEAADEEGDGSPVAAAFEMSYLRLDPEQQRVFRAIGRHPGTDIDAYAAAALAGMPRREAAPALEGLHDHHLVEEHMPQRYSYHDLLREYARNKSAGTGDAEGGRVGERVGERVGGRVGGRVADDSALIRLLDHYRYTALVAVNRLQPLSRNLRPRIDPPGTDVPRIEDAVTATDWLEAEMANLLACVALATEQRWASHATQISHIAWHYLQDNDRYGDAHEFLGLAVAAAREAGDRGSLVRALRFRGSTCTHLGRFREAFAVLTEARDLCEDPNDRAGVAERLGNVYLGTGQLDRAAAEFEDALALWRSLGRVDGEGNALATIAIIDFRLGRYQAARANLLQSLDVYGDQIEPPHLVWTLAWLATVAERAGQYEQACEYADRALGITGSVGQSGNEAEALEIRGRARQHLGLVDESLADLEQALRIRRANLEAPDTCISLLSLGAHHYRRGAHQRAAGHFREALELTGDFNAPASKATALIGLAECLTALGHPDAALPHLRDGLEISRELADPYSVARAQEGLGCALQALGGAAGNAVLFKEAETHIREAHEAYVRLGVPDAARLGARLGAAAPARVTSVG